MKGCGGMLCEIGVILLLTVMVSAMLIPANYHYKGARVWQKCRVVCEKQPQAAGFCPCNVLNKSRLLHKRSPPDGSTQYDLVEGLLISDVINDLLIKELLESEEENRAPDNRYNYPSDNIPRSPLVDGLRKRSDPAKSVASGDSDSLNMVRSKKRWLSLHDQFDSNEKDGDMIVSDLWKADSPRKTFRYG